MAEHGREGPLMQRDNDYKAYIFSNCKIKAKGLKELGKVET